MLLGQLDELTARITQVTDLLDAAIRALPAPTTTTVTTHPSSRTDSNQSVQTPAQAGYNSAVARLCAVPDSVRAVLGELGSRGALLRPGPRRSNAPGYPTAHGRTDIARP